MAYKGTWIECPENYKLYKVFYGRRLDVRILIVASLTDITEDLDWNLDPDGLFLTLKDIENQIKADERYKNSMILVTFRDKEKWDFVYNNTDWMKARVE